MQDYIEVKSFGKVYPKKGTNKRLPYEHQRDAMKCLDIINGVDSYSTMVVLPTGGGKTYTASSWLLRNALDRKKKILWIAHRQMLLDQAAVSFQNFAYAESVPHIQSFNYRIVSGASSHDRSGNIEPSDNLLILSKDSIGRNLSALDRWLAGENEVFLVIDEAHHSTAKTYRKIIDYVEKKVPKVKLIGLTATPFRTAEDEQGLLAKLYRDGVKNGLPVHGDVGIAYQIGLKDLISRRILSKPVFHSKYTDEMYGEGLGIDAWESIQHLDTLPEDIAKQIADSSERNSIIVKTYLENESDFGQTLVFAVNQVHAITLAKLFNKAGIPADFVISNVKDPITGVTISREDNDRKIEDYRRGKLRILTNVNILTEGVDLPQTKTVFLARPTVSKILMTQMVGRALRGTAAGGTDEAHIVSFIDNWNEYIAWVNPESLFGVDNEFTDSKTEQGRHQVRLIASSQIEEFASILDESVDTSAFEKVPFISRIPIGMYAFTYLEENGLDISRQVMVYDSSKDAYEKMMAALPMLFNDFGCDEEYPAVSLLEEMAAKCEDTYFLGEIIPPYDGRDVVEILRYYAQYETAPQFYLFDDIDRERIDVGRIARHIWDERMPPQAQTEYVNSLWNDGDENVLRMLFGRKSYFLKQFQVELAKLTFPDIYEDSENVEYGRRKLEDLPLYEIRQIDPEREKLLRDAAFERARKANGMYACSCCGREASDRIMFQVDHIKPLNKGGKSFPNNLQILCRQCNGAKGDRYD